MDKSNLNNDKRPDRREIIRLYFPDFLYEESDFKIFIDLTCEELGLDSDYIELFPNIISCINSPEQFLPYLSIFYDYRDDKDTEAQREIIKRILKYYKERGTVKSILETADFGFSDDWVGSTLFINKDSIPDRIATIDYPAERIFRHSISKRSGNHKYPDKDRYRDGVIVIVLKYVNDRIKEKMKSVMPAGIKYVFDIIPYSETVTEYTEYEISTEYSLVWIGEIYNSISAQRFSVKKSGGLRSGENDVVSEIIIS